jgi:predicted HD phosphohydrolase
VSEAHMTTVSFTKMIDGTKEDFDLLDALEAEYVRTLAERLTTAVRSLAHSLPGYKVSRLEHSLQSATRAHHAGESEEYVVAALLHDIGDELAPYTHGEMVAAVLRPYVAADICWAVGHHGIFQDHYKVNLSDAARAARERYRDHPYYAACVKFCEQYDQNCFDPEYRSLPLSFFEPMMRRVFAEPRYLQDLR